jgi:hypothetical protein
MIEAKPILKPKTYSTIDAYNLYIKNLVIDNRNYRIANPNGKTKVVKDETGKIVENYTQYKKVIAAFNKKAGIKMVEGYSVDLLNGLGFLFIIRVERGASKPRLNRGESFKLRKKLEANGTLTDDNWRVYYDDEDFIMVTWFKPSYTIVNNDNMKDFKLYKFKVADGTNGKGLKKYISREVVAKPHLKFIYPFVPFTFRKGKRLTTVH